MLRGIRNASANWLGKTVMAIVMGVLIISFAVWGIADIFRGFGQSTIATVGSTDITIEQFRQTYTERLRQFGAQLGRPLTPDQARAVGLDRQILQQSIAEAVLDETARKRGLGLSNDGLKTVITGDPAFRGLNGAFDPARFAQIIRQAGYTEQRFVAEQRQQSLRRQIAATVNAGLTPPASQVDAFVRYQNEERAADFIRLGEAEAGAIETPSAETLSSFFDENKARFRAPEFRKVAVLTVTPASLAKSVAVPDEDVRKAFEQDKARFSKPEKRRLSQLVFADEAAAQAAADRIKAGADFAAIATELGKKSEDTDLGTVAKSDVIDPAVAEAAFQLAEGSVSAPVKGRFGWVLLKTEKIEPGVTPAFEAIAADIRNDLATGRARAKVAEIYNKVEDERAGGANVVEIARKLGLDVTTVEAIDRSGRDPEGKPVNGLAGGSNMITLAFSTDVGVETEAQQADGGYVWLDVLGVTPSRERNFDEVRDRVAERWKTEQVSTRLRARAEDMVKAINGGKAIADVAAEAGLRAESASGLKRQETSQALPPSVVSDIFLTAEGKASQTEGKDGAERFVFVVTKVAVPAETGADASQKVADALKTPLSEELLAQYVVALQSEIGVKINETALRQVTGGGNN